MTTKRRRKKVKQIAKQTTGGPIEIKHTLQCNIRPKTDNQKNYIDSILKNEIIFCTGPAGSGKTLLAINAACVAFVNDMIDKIIITRPLVNCGTGLGWLGGDLNEKIHPYMTPLTDVLKDILGHESYDKLLKEKCIEILPLEVCRGRNFHNTFVIADEMQNATFDQTKMLLTRHGQNSKTVITGDPKQTDLQINQFKYMVKKLSNPNVEGVGFVELTWKDIQRSGIVGRIIQRLEEEEEPIKGNWAYYGKD